MEKVIKITELKKKEMLRELRDSLGGDWTFDGNIWEQKEKANKKKDNKKKANKKKEIPESTESIEIEEEKIVDKEGKRTKPTNKAVNEYLKNIYGEIGSYTRLDCSISPSYWGLIRTAPPVKVLVKKES